jgi:uncharacterized protein
MRTFDQLDNASDRVSISDRQNCTASSPKSDSSPDGATSDEVGHEFVYDLRIDGQSSERFYADVAGFSVRVLAEIDSRAAAVLDGYSRYVTSFLREAPRSRGDYALELLTVGMAARLYGDVAASTPGWVIDLARELYWVRRRSPGLKRLADFLRAGLFQFFMRRKVHRPEGAPAHGSMRPTDESAFARLPRLLEWLQATGEFHQEWRRVDNWRSYWSQLPVKDSEHWMAVSVELFDWFTLAADEALGKYTAGVIHFLENTYATRFWREDQIFCGRLPAEYHLGMVAAEVMNEGLREDFHSRPRKVVLVPGCMRGARSETCKAVRNGLDMTCLSCDPDCAVSRITRRMRYEGIEVYIVPHSSGFSRWLERWQDDPKVGVAAVACMLNILPGGYEMRARRIASQCVPLDFPGCEKHWSEEPVATSVNEERLVQIVTSK